MLRHNAIETFSVILKMGWRRCPPPLRQPPNSFCLDQFLVGNTSISETYNLVDRRLSTKSIKDVFPSSVLHKVDLLKMFSDHCPSFGSEGIRTSIDLVKDEIEWKN